MNGAKGRIAKLREKHKEKFMSEERERIQRLRDFCVVEWDRLQKEVKDLTSKISALEYRKKELWSFIGDLDSLARLFIEEE